MTAIITNQFRIQNLQYSKRDIDNGVDKYYLAIGRSNDWTDDNNPPTPNIDYEDEISARLDMQSMKEITDIVHCVPRYNWVNGNTYVAYDDNDATQGSKQFYVINSSNFNVYICLRAGSGTSTVEPTGVDDGGSGTPADKGSVDPTAGGDGYVWKYLYTISASDADKYLTTDFMPVFRDTNVAANATLGQIWDYNIVNGGSGYSSAPTLAVEGDGAGATATCTIDGGVVDSISVTGVGSGYTYARVVVSGGSPSTAATIAPVLAPVSLGREIASIDVTNGGTSYTNGALTLNIAGDGFDATATATVTGGVIQASPTINTAGYSYTNATVTPAETTAGTTATLVPQFSAAKGGFGYDPVVDLGSYYLMFNVVLTGAEGTGDFVPGNNYRQLMIIKNPLDRSSPPKAFTQSTGTAMPYLDVQAGGTWPNDALMTGVTSGAQAYIVYYDSANEFVYYVQNDDTGYDAFTDGESITGSGISSASIAAAGGSASNPSEIDNLSGRLLYLENRSPVSRASDQTEDIKLVVQF